MDNKPKVNSKLGKLTNNHPIPHNIPGAGNNILSAVTFSLTEKYCHVLWEFGNTSAGRRCSEHGNTPAGR
jgi:hypothetical protein